MSPCILPVLPVIFLAGTPVGADEPGAQADSGAGAVPGARRPYLVIGGLVLSFSLVTLTGSAVLSLLHLPQDAIRWIALTALVAIGLGLIFPPIERPISGPPTSHRIVTGDHSAPGTLEVRPSPGLQVFSFTYG